ncbi:ribosomal protein L21-like protein [Entophlyctis helioformis]|nr:ribosomal protein L21-like protein [Entophlyctis helioformis]
MHNQTKYAAIVEIKNRPYHVAKNDVIVAPRMNDLRLGDVIELDRVREISSPDYVLQGNPYVDPRYFRIRASVVEHAKSKEIVRKHTKRSGDSKTVSNANSHTLLRICEMDIVKTPSQ